MEKICPGEFIRRIRMILGMSQKEFAVKCGIKQQYLSAIECQQRGVSTKMLSRIAEGLDLTVDELVDIGVRNKLEVVHWENGS